MTTTPQQRIYLASRSSRRRELLVQIGVAFDVLWFRSKERTDPEIDETPYPDERADDYVLRLAQAKANHGERLLIQRKLAPRIVLTADTTLEVDGDIIGKPTDSAEATYILRRLSGRSHRVLTGITACFQGKIRTALSVSEVRFRPLEKSEIRRYVFSGEPMDKAGAYGIQGGAGLFIEHISGSYSGIMGLPLCETGLLLKAHGYRFD